MSKYVLEMDGISKFFPGVKALQDVSLKVKAGEVHCLMGENGAGKSTIINILAGLIEMDEGKILIDERQVHINKPHDAYANGISFIFQELSVVNALTVEENMTLGFESSHAGIVDKKENIQRVKDILSKLDIDISYNSIVKDLSVCQKQMMLIAKALSQHSKIIVMDEPTASLTNKETHELFKMIKHLKEEGVTFLYVSHRFEDIFKIGDRITVFRDGKNAGELIVKDTCEEEIIRSMVGRDIEDTFPKRHHSISETVLKVENLCAHELIKDVSFELKRGQVIGVSGLAGAGKTELARALFGDNPITSGEITLKGRKIELKNPKDAISNGIALLPEERRTQGIVGKMTVRENISLVISKRISKWSIISKRSDQQLAKKYIKDINIKTPSSEQQIRLLSGGNQQKAIIGKWLATEADVFLLDEPTRGIDIGAKSEIYEIINNLTKIGKAVLLFSSELPELLGICDEIMIMCNGRLAGTINGKEANQVEIMKLSVGGF
ncbi:MAG: D-xylose ABC transporter ATP-binding protein [Firmicutes bacterium HGW-Firmicutes-7]|nr:MAG: D-xylose ABC transporter ATP-binding protein [Firmicutes bacterium HGW-Firmicutes-7]